MIQKTFYIFTIISLVMACSESESTQSETNPLVGKWTLNVMKENGVALNYLEEDEIPYQLEFYSDERGNIWIKDYGQTTNDSPIPFTWRTSGNTLYLHLSGENQLSMSYSISSNTLTLSMTDGSDTIEYIYNKS